MRKTICFVVGMIVIGTLMLMPSVQALAGIAGISGAISENFVPEYSRELSNKIDSNTCSLTSTEQQNNCTYEVRCDCGKQTNGKQPKTAITTIKVNCKDNSESKPATRLLSPQCVIKFKKVHNRCDSIQCF